MSAEKAEPGDVFVTRGIKEIDWSRRLCVRGYMVEEEGGALKGLCDARDDLPTGFLFNLPALLAGDPFAWAAALSFAPEVFLLVVGEGKEKHEVIGLPKGFSADHIGIHRDGKPCGEADLWWAKADQMWHPQQVECSGASPEFVQAVATAVNAALKGDENA